jgi:hypothetical protein
MGIETGIPFLLELSLGGLYADGAEKFVEIVDDPLRQNAHAAAR